MKRLSRDGFLPLLPWALLLFIGLGTLSGCGGAAETNPAPAPTATPIDPKLAALGKAIAERYDCLSCHSVDGFPMYGPTWRGLYGSWLAFTDGTTALADEAYLREAIRRPLDKVVQGFVPLMPPQMLLSDEEIEAIIVYMKSLR